MKTTKIAQTGKDEPLVQPKVTSNDIAIQIGESFYTNIKPLALMQFAGYAINPLTNLLIAEQTPKEITAIKNALNYLSGLYTVFLPPLMAAPNEKESIVSLVAENLEWLFEDEKSTGVILSTIGKAFLKDTEQITYCTDSYNVFFDVLAKLIGMKEYVEMYEWHLKNEDNIVATEIDFKAYKK